MKKIGFIGAGHIGSTLARLAINAGYDVLLSNRRGRSSLSELVTELGPAASAVTPPEAAAADLVVVTVTLHAIDQLPEAELVGKTVTDTNNYYPDRDGRIPELDSGGSATSEMLQRRLSASKVVKAFSKVVYVHLAKLPRPANDPQRSTLPMAGDDAEAKALVEEFADAVGFDVLDGSTVRRIGDGNAAAVERLYTCWGSMISTVSPLPFFRPQWPRQTPSLPGSGNTAGGFVPVRRLVRC